MLWQGREGSSNVEDRRGLSGGAIAGGGGVIGIIVLLISFFMGDGDVSQLPQIIQNSSNGQTQTLSPEAEAADNERAKFVGVVLRETEKTWQKLFSEQGGQYVEPKLVLFRDAVESGCGGASKASGPFYCPADQKLYIDLSFQQELTERFKAPGEFAMAYVVAHEVGHHVQYLQGTSEKMARLRQQLDEREYNKYSVMLELQADYYAGVFAHYIQNQGILEKGDIESALTAANAIGDDRLQKQSQGTVVPDAFTHGTSAQRMYWFKKGFESGNVSEGNTFKDPSLQ